MALARTTEPAAPPPPPREAHPLPSDLAAIILDVDRKADGWQHNLSVTIGQARLLTGLRESQIRYYEGLEALRPRKSSDQSGANRLFTLTELRRLSVLARLTEQGRRPAEAAELVRTFSHAVDIGARLPISTIARQERGAVADGFLLARLMSQLIAAAQAELAPDEGGAPAVRVRGAILPRRALVDGRQPSDEELAALGDELLQGPAGVLVALVHESDSKVLDDLPAPLLEAGGDQQTVLFYSPEPHPLGVESTVRYCAYIPPDAPQNIVMLLIDGPGRESVPLVLHPVSETRAWLLDTLLALCEAMAKEFCRSTLSKGHRYRSDGFPLSFSRDDSAGLLEVVRTSIFPGDDQSLAVLLVPNSLDCPESLSILAHSGYMDELVKRAKLDLRGDTPQGLSGRAYVLRELFLSLHAESDRRVEYALEEGCRQAMAVPLASTWAAAPFGVLYMATRSSDGALDSRRAYMALILGGILGELLGRWWLTRLRKDLDTTLHRRLESIVGWIDSLDERGPDFERGLKAVSTLWGEIARNPDDAALRRQRLSLAVLDIDHYRRTVQSHSNEPLPLRVQCHVNEAMARVAPRLRGYWFKNDHALLILPEVAGEQAEDLLARIIDQVALTPLELPGHRGPLKSITVSIAYRELTYKALHELGCRGEATLHQQIGVMVRQLCAQTRQAEPGELIKLGASPRAAAVGK